jgi:uncharacterized membrane protein YqaE (UPF0057 family)
MKKFFLLCTFLLSLLASQPMQAGAVGVLPVEPQKEQRFDEGKTQKLSRKERKALRKQLKRESKALKQAPTQTQADAKLILCIILAILIPCIGVLVWQGDLTIDFLITLLLMLLFWLPGIIYAIYVIVAK